MEFMKSFMDQSMIAMIGEICLFANTVTMAMPTRWRESNLLKAFFFQTSTRNFTNSIRSIYPHY